MYGQLKLEHLIERPSVRSPTQFSIPNIEMFQKMRMFPDPKLLRKLLIDY